MIKVGTIINNQELIEMFKCANSGGMRRSHKTNSLVLIVDHTKSLYDDSWKNDVLFYTGMGLKGNQRLDFMQNKTLSESRTNGVVLHLFEVYKAKEYTYKGKVYLFNEPFKEKQKDKNNQLRDVWIFPLKLVS